MPNAKFYIYRNLHTGGFSVKHRGIVVERSHNIVADNITFKVNELGRDRVIRERRKNVHAYVVCDKYVSVKSKISGLKVVTYNPYASNMFTCNGNPIEHAKRVALVDGKCYLVN